MTPPRIRTLNDVLPPAQREGYAVGAFSPRYERVILPILRTADRLRSPVIVQVAQVELGWYEITVEDFASAFGGAMEVVRPTVPVVLHLDHTQDPKLIRRAIDAGFSSVMIDASMHPLEENIAITREVVAYAHERGVSVEAELGRIASADGLESGQDEELYTDPEEAARFVEETGVDALAVSVGTLHGVYQARRPTIDLERLRAIRSRTAIPLVLHGGSGVPAELLRAAILLPEGGISKVNIATELELALLETLHWEQRMTNAQFEAFSEETKDRALDAVAEVVATKIELFLLSEQRVD
ncbi:MAG: ketose-bisphosphate aldolase [Anaerolineales bacterium]